VWRELHEDGKGTSGDGGEVMVERVVVVRVVMLVRQSWR
jgi:hypothetical protein